MLQGSVLLSDRLEGLGLIFIRNNDLRLTAHTALRRVWSTKHESCAKQMLNLGGAAA